MTFYFKISKLKFYVILVLILLMPVSKNYRLLLFGIRTEGIAMGYNESQSISAIPANSDYTSFRFETEKGSFYISAPENITYKSGEKAKIIYDKNSPEKCMIYSFSYLYSGPNAIIPGVLFILWIAFYTSFKKPAKRPGVPQNHST